VRRTAARRKPGFRSPGLASETRARPAALRVARGFREALLTVVALLGLACILALMVQVDPRELVPGDVVSVRREAAAALVTHRVVAVDPPTGAGATASLWLRGDANISNDPLPYDVATAQKVLFTVPALGTWVMASRGPEFLGAATLAVAALVTWAYWPRRRAAVQAEIGDARGAKPQQ